MRNYLDQNGRVKQKIANLTVAEYCEIQNKLFLERPFAEENGLRYGWGLVVFANNVSRYVDYLPVDIDIDYRAIDVKTTIESLEKIAAAHEAVSIVQPIFLKHMKACLQEIQTVLPAAQEVCDGGFRFENFRIPFTKIK